MASSRFTPAKNRFRAHGNSHYYLATEDVTAADQNGDVTGSATSSCFRDVRAQAGYVIYNVGDSVFFNDIRGLDHGPMDQLRLQLRPSTHDFTWTPSGELEVVVGFSTGEIVSYLPLRKDQATTQYSRGSFETTSAVTDIRWAPGRPGCFVAAHAQGSLLVFDSARSSSASASGPASPSADGSAHAGSSGVDSSGTARASEEASASARKASSRKGGSNDRRGLGLWRSFKVEERKAPCPVACWQIGQSAIHQLAFSHDGRQLAMVSADGLLRVFDFASEQLLVSFRSYYAGLLCVAWSPDDAHLVTGGEDDLVSVWSLHGRKLVARGQGHTSWVTGVAFDPFAPGMAAEGGRRLRLGIQPQATVVSPSDVPVSYVRANKRESEGGGPPRPPPVKARAPRSVLAFGSVGMDAKLLLWELELQQPDDSPTALLQTLEIQTPLPSQVHVSHSNGLQRAATPGSKTKLGRLPAAHVPQSGQFSVSASPMGSAPSPGPSVSAKSELGLGESSSGGAASHPGPGRSGGASKPSPGHQVINAVALSAAPLLTPIGGVAAHNEPVAQLVFTQSAILTVCLAGNLRVWIPRIPPGPASSAVERSSQQVPFQLAFNLVTVQTNSQQIISATTKACFIDPSLNSISSRSLRISN